MTCRDAEIVICQQLQQQMSSD